MVRTLTFIGFGEAGRAFSVAGARAFDRKTDEPSVRGEMVAAYAAAGIEGVPHAANALAGADTIISLVTADQALAVAEQYGPFLEPGALWLDMNSVAPGTKRRAAAVIEAAGGRYVDIAIMAPVLPGRRTVPLIIAGPHALVVRSLLEDLEFSNVAAIGPEVGDASAIKMIRSVLVKGLEALSAECLLAAARARVSEAVIASLDSTWRQEGWEARTDYNLDRMLVHGLRRAAEMEEAARTLEELGIDPVMTRGTIARQRALGALGLEPPTSLAAKLAAIDPGRKDTTA